MTKRELQAALASISYLEQCAAYGAERKRINAREGQRKRWERHVDPAGVLPQRERARRAHAAMTAHLKRANLIQRIDRDERRAAKARMARAS